MDNVVPQAKPWMRHISAVAEVAEALRAPAVPATPVPLAAAPLALEQILGVVRTITGAKQCKGANSLGLEFFFLSYRLFRGTFQPGVLIDA